MSTLMIAPSRPKRLFQSRCFASFRGVTRHLVSMLTITDNQVVIIAVPLGSELLLLHGYDMNADGCQRLARLAAWRGVVCRISVPSALGPLGRLERRLLSNLGQTGSLFTPSIRRPNFNIVEPQIIVEDKTPPGQ